MSSTLSCGGHPRASTRASSRRSASQGRPERRFPPGAGSARPSLEGHPGPLPPGALSMIRPMRTLVLRVLPAGFLAFLALDVRAASADDAYPEPPPAPVPQPAEPPLPQPPPDGAAVPDQPVVPEQPWRPQAKVDPSAFPAGDDKSAQKVPMDELKKLVGPIALYPDPVLAQLLPASAYPLDVVAAARWIRENGGKVEKIPEDKPWNASVIALLQFPELVLWMDENLEWLEALGNAITLQQPEVLEAIQQFRRDAKKAGNLTSNDKQKVYEQPAPPEAVVGGEPPICIEPAQPETVYIPTYDPVAVCQPAPYYGYGYGYPYAYGYYPPLISFGIGYGCGAWGG